jgi:hypothetical protein
VAKGADCKSKWFANRVNVYSEKSTRFRLFPLNDLAAGSECQRTPWRAPCPRRGRGSMLEPSKPAKDREHQLAVWRRTSPDDMDYL